MKDCAKQMLRKKKKDGKKVCEFYGKTFGQKYNRDRHVNTQKNQTIDLSD